MTRYQPGDTYRVSLDTTQPGPPLVRVDADTVTLTITHPNGTTTIAKHPHVDTFADVIHSGLGAYYFDTEIQAAGTTLYRWNAVGTNPDTTGWTVVEGDQVYAMEPGPRLLSLDEAKEALRYRPSSDTGRDDDAINDLIDEITQKIESIVGPVLPRTVTERITVLADWQSRYALLSQWPLIDLVSFDGDDDPDGAVAAFTIEPAAGIDPNIGRIRLSSGAVGSYPYGQGMLTYRAGRVPTPAAIRAAGREWIKHRWRGSQQRSGANPGQILTTDDYQARNPEPGPTYGIPLEVADDLRPFARPGML